MNKNFDIIIIGAGVIGTSIAYYLARLGLTNVLLVEKEGLPGMGSTSKANGGIRAQFTTEVNICMSLLSMKLLDEMEDEMRRQCGYQKAGYLFVTATEERLKQLEKTVKFQQQTGVSVKLLTPREIEASAPFVRTDDLAGGSFGSRDGFISPNGLMYAFFTRALAMGVQYQSQTEVKEIVRQGRRVTGVKTTSGEFFADIVINCSGPEAAITAGLAGIELPVQPVRRQIVVTGPINTIPRVIPMTIDMDTGLLVRRDGEAVSLAYANADEPPGYNLKFDPEFIEVVAPKMLKRFPVFEPAGFNFSRGRAGCYAVTPDHHPIIGDSGIPGFMLCTGFSGHGVMHAPAAGLAMAELILKGRTESIDIAPLSVHRFSEGQLLQEGIVL